MEVQNSLMRSMVDIPLDVIHRIFEVSLPTSLPESISTRADAIKFFSSTPPYNFAFTCRAWRDVALSSHSLWSSMFFSFDLPGSEDINALRLKIVRHLDRAGQTPLTIFLRLSSRYNSRPLHSRHIIFLIHSRRATWKRVFLDVDAPIISTFTLGVGGLQLLEEIRIGSSVKLSVQESTLPSLKCLELEGLAWFDSLVWLGVAPNLQELGILNVPLTSMNPWMPQNFFHRSSLRLLRTLRITRAKRTAQIPRVVFPVGLAAGVLSHITCHALCVLDLYLDKIDCHRTLVDFLHRSSPPLEVLGLDVHFVTQGDEEDREQLVVDAFSCVPSVRKLRYRGDLDATACPEIVVRGLSRNLDGDSSSRILPELEVLELVDVVASIHPFIDIVKVRCQSRVDTQALKSVSLFGCFAKPPGELMLMEREELGNFEPGDDFSQLPASLSALGEYISAGMEFRMKQVLDNDRM
ncbi:hypothetical protein SCHPADRAFT_712600 [Schizopora paradoxa]|uniref:F-box domain-containing protein n=1 Tax=Schizopora paradoxa TaxID=27342 RepID=A0A0H2R8D1_9AGAM|nr:hypothetical protein SCHPADRAFT_712600 [Schizopora paradoxa]